MAFFVAKLCLFGLSAFVLQSNIATGIDLKSDVIFVTGGQAITGCDPIQSAVRVLDLTTYQWCNATVQLPAGLAYHASVQNLPPNEDLLLIGGVMNWCPGQAQQSSKIYSYNKNTNVFTESTQYPALPYPLWKATAVFDFRGRLFVIGNLLAKSETKMLYFENGKWNESPASNNKRIGAAIAIDQTRTKIYFVGGSVNGSDNSTSVEYFDTGYLRWNQAFDMQFERFGHAETTYNNWLYVCGGEAKVNGSDYPKTNAMCEKLDTANPIGASWQHIDDMIVPRSAFSLLVHRERLAAVAGYSFQDVSKIETSMEILLPDQDKWFPNQVPSSYNDPKNVAGASAIFMPLYPHSLMKC